MTLGVLKLTPTEKVRTFSGTISQLQTEGMAGKIKVS